MQARLIWVLVRREVRDSVTDWRISTPMVSLSLLLPTLMLIGLKVGGPALSAIAQMDVVSALIPFGTLMAGFFPSSFSLIVALESFVGEKERNTMEALLSTPISDQSLYLGKFAASVVPPLFLSYAATLLFAWGVGSLLEFALAPRLVALMMALSTLVALVMVAGAVVVSSHTASVRAANLLASFIILPMSMVVTTESLLIVTNHLDALPWIALELLVVTIILLRMGLRVFRREELLSRGQTGLDLRLTLRSMGRFLRALPSDIATGAAAMPPRLTVRRLLRQDLPQVVWLNRMPLLLVTATMLAGVTVGYAYAMQFPLNLSSQQMQIAAGPGGLNHLVGTLNPLTFFQHNLRSLVLYVILGLFSFGAAPLLFLGATMILVGFILGQAVHLGYDPLIFLAVTILPHGVFELAAAMLTAALSVKLGLSVMSPPPGLSIGQAMLAGLANLLKIAWLVALLLLLAAVIEAWITPALVLWFYGR
jgi:uncharacterized membrane protein SpoIIM required for sporulation/ABC-type transport system involved in multi-copper enzyme maturation permease subunit